MPLYRYRCTSCGADDERFVPMDERHNQRCERCSSPLGVRVSAPMWHWKRSANPNLWHPTRDDMEQPSLLMQACERDEKAVDRDE